MGFGYLGFGMRKEVYKRKPRRAFKKAKQLGLPAPKPDSDAGHKASKTYQEIRFKPAYKRGWFQVLAILIIAFIVYVYLNDTVFAEKRHNKAISQFEETGITDYYQAEKSALDSVVNFIKARDGKIAWIKGGYGKLSLQIRSENYQVLSKGFPDGDHHRYRGEHQLENHLEPEVIDGNLKFYLYKYQKVYEDYWSQDLTIRYTQDVNTTFVKHLETNYEELNVIFRILAIKHWDVNTLKHGTSVEFSRLGNSYFFVLTDRPDSIKGNKLMPLDSITGGTYWTDSVNGW